MRGSILDILWLGSIWLSLIFLAYILYNVVQITTPIGLSVADQLGAPTGMNMSNSTIALQQTQVAANNFALIVPVVIGLSGLAAIVAASFLPVHPIFLPIGIFMLLVAVIIFYNVQSVMSSIFGDSFFLPAVTAFPLPAYIAQNLAWLVLAFGAGVLVVMYGFGRSRGTPEG